MMGVHHIPDCDVGERRGAVRRRRADAIAERVHGYDVKLDTVDQLSRAHQSGEVFDVSAEPGWEQHGIRALGIQPAVNSISDAAILDRLAAFETKTSKVGKLLRRLRAGDG